MNNSVVSFVSGVSSVVISSPSLSRNFLQLPHVSGHLRIRILRYDPLVSTVLVCRISQQLLIVRSHAIHFLYRYYPRHELRTLPVLCPIHLRSDLSSVRRSHLPLSWRIYVPSFH